MDNKTYLELTEEEIRQRAKLTPKEQLAVKAFITAAKALPESLHIALDDWDTQHLKVSKRITRGSSEQVAGLRKKSLCF